MENIFFWFLLFMMYSILGLLIEIPVIFIDEKKLILNRGFLIGPYLPIFGAGSIAMVLLLYEVTNYFNIFILSVLICGTIEYIVSYVMEKMFSIRWWDYTHNKYHLNGRIELTRLILFGFGGIINVKILYPTFTTILNKLSSEWIINIGFVIFVIFIIDYIISFFVAFKLKGKIESFISADQTENFKKEVTKFLNKNNYLLKRIFINYPEIKDFIKNIPKKIKKK